MSLIGEYIRRLPEYLRVPLYRNAIYLMADRVLMAGLGFLFWIVIARTYTDVEAGFAAAIIPVILFLALLSRFGFEIALVRFLPSAGKNSRSIINSCLTISGIGAILISVVFLLGLEFWAPALLFIRARWELTLSFILFTVTFALLVLMTQVFVARRKSAFVMATTLVGGVRIALLVVFAVYFGAFGVLASWGFAETLAVIIGMLLFMRIVIPGYKPIPTMRWGVVKDMVRYSAGNYVAAIFGMLPAALLPLLVLHELPTENVAYYYIAYTISSLLFAITGAVCMSLFAEGSHFEREWRGNVNKALKLIFLLQVPGVLFVMFFGGYLLLLFGGDYSSEGFVLLQVFSIASIFMAFNGVFLATRRVLKRMWPIIAIPAFNAFVIVSLAHLLLGPMGLVGTSIAWALSHGLVSLGIGVYYVVLHLRGLGGSALVPT
ncbi:MAG: oligosaccharide flippase family protein [Candidatus Thermoplasmatota archaeon]|nr:oligosaccharide flippase family protein [Candidatus Thermoplasmatota archaeon]